MEFKIGDEVYRKCKIVDLDPGSQDMTIYGLDYITHKSLLDYIAHKSLWADGSELIPAPPFEIGEEIEVRNIEPFTDDRHIVPFLCVDALGRYVCISKGYEDLFRAGQCEIPVTTWKYACRPRPEPADTKDDLLGDAAVMLDKIRAIHAGYSGPIDEWMERAKKQGIELKGD